MYTTILTSFAPPVPFEKERGLLSVEWDAPGYGVVRM